MSDRGATAHLVSVVVRLEVFEICSVPGNVEFDAPLPVLLLVEVADVLLELGAADLYLTLDVFGLEATWRQKIWHCTIMLQVVRYFVRDEFDCQFLQCVHVPVIFAVHGHFHPVAVIFGLHSVGTIFRSQF